MKQFTAIQSRHYSDVKSIQVGDAIIEIRLNEKRVLNLDDIREANEIMNVVEAAPDLLTALADILDEFHNNHQNGVHGDALLNRAYTVYCKALGINEPQNA